MEQLLAHLVGDYILQTDRQANLKRKSLVQAFIHATTYTLPFLFLTQSPWAILMIWLSHGLIDHFGIASYIVRLKNSLGAWDARNTYVTATGYPDTAPDFLKIWLLIVADNTIHLLINYSSIRWL